MRASAPLVVTFASGLLVYACGGASGTTDLFGPPTSEDGGGGHVASSSGGTSPGSSSGGVTSSSSGAMAAGSSGGGSSSGSAGSSGSSSGAAGSSSGAASSSGGSSGGAGSSSGGMGSSSGTSADPGIYCGRSQTGDVYCTVDTQDCCISGSGQNASYRCMTALTCGFSGAISVACDNSAECTGNQVCCGTIDPQSDTYEMVQCAASCDPENDEHTFCDPNAAVDVCASIPSDNGPPYTCTASTILPGYYVCSNGQ
jgi:hypothetical protein